MNRFSFILHLITNSSFPQLPNADGSAADAMGGRRRGRQQRGDLKSVTSISGHSSSVIDVILDLSDVSKSFHIILGIGMSLMNVHRFEIHRDLWLITATPKASRPVLKCYLKSPIVIFERHVFLVAEMPKETLSLQRLSTIPIQLVEVSQ